MMQTNIESGFCITIGNSKEMNQAERLPFIFIRLNGVLSVYISSMGHLCKSLKKTLKTHS